MWGVCIGVQVSLLSAWSIEEWMYFAYMKRDGGGGSARMVVGRKMFWKGSEDGLLVFEKW